MPDEESYLTRNDTLLSIHRRRSVRSFSNAPVSDHDLQTILQAAHQAPSAHNQQSWRFIVLKGEKKDQLVDLITARSAGFPRAAAALLRMGARSIASAPVVIAVMNTGELITRGTELFQVDRAVAHDFFRIMEIQSSAASVQNMLIAATSLGLGTVWLGVLVLVKDDVLRLLGEPEGEFMAIVPVGYPVKPGVKPAKRSLQMVVKHL